MTNVLKGNLVLNLVQFLKQPLEEAQLRLTRK